MYPHGNDNVIVPTIGSRCYQIGQPRDNLIWAQVDEINSHETRTQRNFN